MAALGENDPVKLGEQTRRIAADRAVPGDKTINEAENDKFMAERLAALGVTTK